MRYLSDTVRVEVSLPIHMMLAVLLSGANCAPPSPDDKAAWLEFDKRLQTDLEFAEAYRIFESTKLLLTTAADEMLEGISPEKKKISLLRRIERAHRDVIQPYLKGDEPDPRKIGIITYFLLRHLIESGFLRIEEGSSFDQALDLMLPALSPWEGSTPEEERDYERLNHSAQKQVKHVLQRLQTEGYYVGISLPN